MRFERYQDALKFARKRARETGLALSIRRQAEYGTDGYNVSFAAVLEAGLNVEIVRPLTPEQQRRVDKIQDEIGELKEQAEVEGA